MDTSNLNKVLQLLTVLIILYSCKNDYKPKPIALNNFSYVFSFPDTTKEELKNSKILVIQKGQLVDSGRFRIVDTLSPVSASIEFYNNTRVVNKEDTIVLNMGKAKHIISDIKEISQERNSQFSPFSSSAKPFSVEFKVDGKPYNENDIILIK